MSSSKTTQPPETRSGGHQPPAGAATAIVHLGDCIEVMNALPERRFHCVVTSPPYFGLRDYGHDGQIGLEETPELFVARLVDVFREVRRILRDDGVLWVNMGDSYNAREGQRKATDKAGEKQATSEGSVGVGSRCVDGLKPKDLIGVPWMLAFALRADGWYLRSDVIWHKPSVMPESVTDRPTKSHEYVFLLTKNARYYYDAEAIKEPVAASTAGDSRMEREGYDVGRPERGFPGQAQRGSGLLIPAGDPSTRNKRTVWTVPSQGYDEAHFATYPPALVEPCIKAGTSERGCCAECGAPWVRVIDKVRRATRPGEETKVKTPGKNSRVFQDRDPSHPDKRKERDDYRPGLEIGNRDPQRHVTESRTVGWKASCECGAAVVPCRVFDPFTGSGTTLAVANQLGRDAEGSELNPEYKAMAERRIGRANKPNTFRDESKAEASGLFSNASEQP